MKPFAYRRIMGLGMPLKRACIPMVSMAVAVVIVAEILIHAVYFWRGITLRMA